MKNEFARNTLYLLAFVGVCVFFVIALNGCKTVPCDLPPAATDDGGSTMQDLIASHLDSSTIADMAPLLPDMTIMPNSDMTRCAAAGDPCCSNDGVPYCDAPFVCVNGSCLTPCGGDGEPCCQNSMCSVTVCCPNNVCHKFASDCMN